MLIIKVNDLKKLYDLDDAQWLEETVSLLKKHQFQQLDLDNLIEELEDLGKINDPAASSGVL